MSITGSSKRKRVDASTLAVSQNSTLGGDVTCNANVDILGDLAVSGTTSIPVVVPSVVYTDDGTDALPSYSFIDEKDVGFSRPSTGEVAFVSGGSKRLRMSDTAVTATVPVSIANGSVSAPALNFSAAPTTGMFLDTGFVKVAVAGTEVLEVRNTGVISTGKLDAFGDVGTLGDYYGINAHMQDGTASAPSYAFTNDSTAGMYLLPSHAGVGITHNSFTPVAIFNSSGTTLTTLNATTINASGDVKALNVTATGTVDGGTVTGDIVIPRASGAIYMTTASPDAIIASQTADIVICPVSQEVARFNTTAATFSVPVNVPYNITGGNGTFSALTGSTVTASNQVLTTFVVTSGTTISTSSFTLFNGWNTTPAVSRGSTPVTVSGSTFTINSTGYWDVGFQIMWAANATGQRSATMRVNGAPTNFAYDIRNAVTGGFVTSNMGSIKRYFSSGDTVAVEVWQNSGGNLDIQNNGNQIVGMSFIRIC